MNYDNTQKKNLKINFVTAVTVLAFVVAIVFSLNYVVNQDDFNLINFAKASSEEVSEAEAETGIVGMFGLNWKLFLAQLVNFGIVLFVLWKWVFGPLTKGLSERTARIEASLVEAEKITEERNNFNVWKNEQITVTRKEANDIIHKAKTDTEVIKQQILDDTKAEQTKLTEQAKVAMLRDKEVMLTEAKSEMATMIIQATEKILEKELDAKKHTDIINATLKSAKDNF